MSMHGDDGLPSARWQTELARVGALSDRELQVFALLGAGLSNRGIATRLQVTERTVKAHVASILTKLEVESRLQVGLVAQAHQLMYEGTVSNGSDVIDN
jgi:DNA-binding NarL/FixJ family response regulator